MENLIPYIPYSLFVTSLTLLYRCQKKLQKYDGFLTAMKYIEQDKLKEAIEDLQTLFPAHMPKKEKR